MVTWTRADMYRDAHEVRCDYAEYVRDLTGPGWMEPGYYDDSMTLAEADADEAWLRGHPTY